jgi:hypothetical protein
MFRAMKRRAGKAFPERAEPLDPGRFEPRNSF